MNLWNKKDLEPPAITSYKASSFIDVHQLRCHFKEAVEYFSAQVFLEKEAALLSRCIYRMKTKFRSDKGLKSMEKLNRALLQYNYIKFSNILDDFFTLLPEDITSNIHLPTKNMLDYILIRLQGITQLMYRITETAKITAASMGSRICIGQFWKVALIMLGLVSRIWIICKDIMKECCRFYKNILHMRYILKNIGSDWLPDDYNFPDNLEDWLGIDWVKMDNTSSFEKLKSHISSYSVSENSDLEDCGEYIDIKDDEVISIISNDKSNDEKPDMFGLLLQNEDLGEEVCNLERLASHEKVSKQRDGKKICNTKNKSTVKPISTVDNKVSRNKKVERKDKISRYLHKESLNINTDTDKRSINMQNKKLNTMEFPTTNECTPKQHGNLNNNDKCMPIGKKGKHKKKASHSELIDNINSVKELRIFIIKEAQRRENKNTSCVFSNLDKLQWTMLTKHIKKIIKKVERSKITDSECLSETKNMLQSNLK